MAVITIRQIAGFQTDIEFGGSVPNLIADEPPPLSQGTGPSPDQLLASAVGNCLLASLYFALTKFKNQPKPIECKVSAEVGRNQDNKLRILGINATLQLQEAASALHETQRAVDQFEAFCTVTQSVRASIPVSVQVFDGVGNKLKG